MNPVTCIKCRKLKRPNSMPFSILDPFYIKWLNQRMAAEALGLKDMSDFVNVKIEPKLIDFDSLPF